MDNEFVGYVKNVCKQCGDVFPVGYYKGETPEDAVRPYCLPCLFGLTKEDFSKALSKMMAK